MLKFIFQSLFDRVKPICKYTDVWADQPYWENQPNLTYPALFFDPEMRFKTLGDNAQDGELILNVYVVDKREASARDGSPTQKSAFEPMDFAQKVHLLLDNFSDSDSAVGNFGPLNRESYAVVDMSKTQIIQKFVYKARVVDQTTYYYRNWVLKTIETQIDLGLEQ